jgi:AcrR family transcriptional regulator
MFRDGFEQMANRASRLTSKGRQKRVHHPRLVRSQSAVGQNSEPSAPLAAARLWAAEQSASTRRQLILAGMRLMAEEGIEGVSLRAVNVAAGAKNSSAAHYHFGNKVGLIEAIVELLHQEVAAVRAPLMQRLRDRSRQEPLTARAIIDSAYGPFMGLLFHPEYGLPGIKFLSRLIVDTSPSMRPIVNRFTSPLVHEVQDLLRVALPDIAPRVLQMRILCSLINLINGMGDVLALESSPFGDMSTPGSLEAAHLFLEYITNGIAAPTATMSEEFIAQSRDIIRTYRESVPKES